MTETMELEAPARPLGAYTRPKANTGWRDWVTTIDHKKIGTSTARRPWCSSSSVALRLY